MERLLVLDFSIYKGKAVMYTKTESGLEAEELSSFKNEPIVIFGQLCWDIDKLFGEVKKVIPKALEMGAEAVSISTWGLDFALINKKGEYVEKPNHYMDKRNAAVFTEMSDKVNKNEFYRRTGIKYMKRNTIVQLYALKKNFPEQLLKASNFLMLPDLFAFLLTGERKNEYTIASTTGLLNCVTKDWDYELIRALHFPENIFSPVIYPGEIYGYLSEHLCEGYKRIPVIAAPGRDTAAAAAAMPMEKNMAYIGCGKWTVCGTLLDEPVNTPEAAALGMSNEGGPFGKINFMKKFMGMWIADECKRYYDRREDEPVSMNELKAAAACVEPYRAFIDPNAPEFQKKCDMPEVIAEYCRRTNQFVPKTKGEVMRVIYDSLALTFKNTISNIEKLTGTHYEKIYLFGETVRNTALRNAVTDMLKRPVIIGSPNAAAFGSASFCFSLNNITPAESPVPSLLQSNPQ